MFFKLLLTPRFDVKALLLIKRASGSIFSENSNIFPFCWMPIWVIVTLLRALISSSVAIWILTCVFSRTLSYILIRSKKACTKYDIRKQLRIKRIEHDRGATISYLLMAWGGISEKQIRNGAPLLVVSKCLKNQTTLLRHWIKETDIAKQSV